MTEAESKRLPLAAQPVPEGSGFDKPGRGESWDLERFVRKTTVRLSRDFAEDLARDPVRFRRRVVSLIKAGLRTRGPGRPGLPEVTAASAMRDQGKPWREIYAACIPDYASLDPTVRRWRQRDLRDRVRSRRNQRRRRKERKGRSPASPEPERSP